MFRSKPFRDGLRSPGQKLAIAVMKKATRVISATNYQNTVYVRMLDALSATSVLDTSIISELAL